MCIRDRLWIADECRLDSSLAIIGNGNVIFNSSSSGVTIQTEGVAFPDTLTLDGAGYWELNDSITVQGLAFFKQGELRSNSMKMTLNDFYLATNGELKLDESIVELKGDWILDGSFD